MADFGSGHVYLFDGNVKNPQQIGEIRDVGPYPGCDVVDDRGTLYVLDDASGDVYVYPRGAVHPSYILKNGLESGEAFTLAIGRDRTLYVGLLTGQVLEYDAGARSPSRTIVLSAVEGMDVDRHDNLYVATTQDSPSPESYGVFEFAHHALTGRALGMHVGIAGGLKIDRSGDVVLGDQSGNTIGIYPPGHKVPSKTWPVHEPYNFALDPSNAYLYVADTQALTIFKYPAGTYAGSISGRLRGPGGVAISNL